MAWTTIRRESGLVEHVCDDGIGHPNPASAYRLAYHHVSTLGHWMTHDCDGCCSREDFPGEVINNISHVYEKYQSLGSFALIENADPFAATIIQLIALGYNDIDMLILMQERFRDHFSAHVQIRFRDETEYAHWTMIQFINTDFGG